MNPRLRNASFSSANRTLIEKRALSRLGHTTMAALVLAAAAFISTEPATAASSVRATYCLSSDSQVIATSRAYPNARRRLRAGLCDRQTEWPGERGPEEFYRSHAALRVGPR
jgi:hypothetical protein